MMITGSLCNGTQAKPWVWFLEERLMAVYRGQDVWEQIHIVTQRED